MWRYLNQIISAQYYLLYKSIDLFFQITKCRLELVFDWLWCYGALWVCVEEDRWVCYNFRTRSFLEDEFARNEKFNIFSLPTNDPSDIIHDDVTRVFENVLLGIERLAIEAEICLHGGAYQPHRFSTSSRLVLIMLLWYTLANLNSRKKIYENFFLNQNSIMD